MNRTILVTGGQGQVGQELARYAWPDGFAVDAPGRATLDLSSRQSIEGYFAKTDVAAIINCAAYTAVDRAEDEPSNAYDVNAVGVGSLARSARALDIPMVHVSTDYVFGASNNRPHRETDSVAPSGVYGASKLAGEIAAAAACDRLVILRTAWVVSPFRSNFVKTMLRLATEHDEIGVVADQRGNPTGAHDLAQTLATIAIRMIGDGAAPLGVYHFVNEGEATWAELAEAVMAAAGRHGLPSAIIKKIATADFPTRAVRPADSRLDTAKIRRDYGIMPRSWWTMVESTVAELATTKI
jgi:dTDP-4-dehydrorhamnose reductase